MSDSAPDAVELTRGRRLVLLSSVLLVAACGLAYEIIAGAVGTYLLGDGVFQFSLTIGVFLSAMGLGSFLSRYVRDRLVARFLAIEVVIAVVGAALAPMLLLTYASGGPYVVVLIASLGTIGVLSGMEIPLLLRIFRTHESLRESASSVLGLDYIGALAGSLIVPIVLLPYIGTIGASCIFGLVNLGIAVIGVLSFPGVFRRRGLVLALIAVLAVPMAVGVAASDAVGRYLEEDLYQDPVVFAKTTHFQRIVLTRWRGDLRLFLNGSLQFSSRDEYRYHESLVHPAMAAAPRRGRVLVMGGGDGLAVREVLRWPDVQRVDLVDLDAAVTDLARRHPSLTALNAHALDDPRVTVHNGDALKFAEGTTSPPWDVVIMDLPDPSSPALSRLYARSTFRLFLRRLAPDGVLVTQATSPFFAREAYWCIASTLAGLRAGGSREVAVHPYRALVPSFGQWGFIIASAAPIDWNDVSIDVPTRYLTHDTLPGMFAFPSDEARPPGGEACVNRLDDPVLARAYRKNWSRFGL